MLRPAVNALCAACVAAVLTCAVAATAEAQAKTSRRARVAELAGTWKLPERASPWGRVSGSARVGKDGYVTFSVEVARKIFTDDAWILDFRGGELTVRVLGRKRTVKAKRDRDTLSVDAPGVGEVKVFRSHKGG